MEEIKNEDWNRPQEPQFKPENKRVIAGITGILLGGLGVHKFILGYTNEGIIQIVISICTCGVGSVIGLIEGIIYLTKTDEEFYHMYQVNKKGWF
jgi:TM2 domain-containing membrane protein YozV